MLDSLTKKQKFLLFIILSIMIIIIIYYIYSNLYSDSTLLNNENTYLNSSDFIENTYNNYDNTETNTIVVYICGAVKESKVISLNENSRICDAIDAVGGLTTDADLTNINLAYILEDGEKIYIPKKGEAILNNDLPSSSINFSTSTAKININKASQTELETIPGIGPSTALKIINYREENGKFKKIEDIKKVPGIGDVKFENIKEYISIK